MGNLLLILVKCYINALQMHFKAFRRNGSLKLVCLTQGSDILLSKRFMYLGRMIAYSVSWQNDYLLSITIWSWFSCIFEGCVRIYLLRFDFEIIALLNNRKYWWPKKILTGFTGNFIVFNTLYKIHLFIYPYRKNLTRHKINANFQNSH